jgi:hypothetical protein
LGVSVTPELTTINTVTRNNLAAFNIDNYSDYDQPSWEVILVKPDTTEQTLEVVTTRPAINTSSFRTNMANKAFINSGGYLNILVPDVTGTYKVKIRVQDFGDIASEYLEHNFTVNDISFSTGTSYQYWRLTSTRESAGNASTDAYMTDTNINASQYIMIYEMSFFEGSGGSGTERPDIAMSGNTTGSYVASASSVFINSASYQPWKAFDNSNSTFWWSFNATAGTGTDYIQLEMDQARSIESFSVYNNNLTYHPWGFKLQASSTGAFAGEEVDIFEIDGWAPDTSASVFG